MLTEVGWVYVDVGGLRGVDLSEIFGGNGWPDSDLKDEHTNWFFSEVDLDWEWVSAVGNVLSDYWDCWFVSTDDLGWEDIVASVFAVDCAINESLGKIVKLNVDYDFTPNVRLSCWF